MDFCEIAFWACAGVVAYAYLLYPATLALLARAFARPFRPVGPPPRSVSIVVAVHNEERHIDRRLIELAGLLERSGLDGEVVVVSDGSTDGTCALARAHTKRWVRVLDLEERGGKAVALSRGVAEATGEVVVFADARQSWAPDALARLLEHFRDPAIGAVSGDLVLAGPGALAGVGLYWRYEKWQRRCESALGAQVGVTGAISAVRRELFRPIPAGTVLDDVYWPLQVALQGKRVIHDSQAVAFDQLPDRPRDEFRRKVRTLAGNFQLACRLPTALLPGYSPVWVQFLSRKLLRLAVPWALLAMLVLALLLPGPFYGALFAAQLAFYGLGLFGLLTPRCGKLTSAPASFLVLNAAAWVAFWVWVTGRAERSWGKVQYAAPSPPGPLSHQGGEGEHERVLAPPLPLGWERGLGGEGSEEKQGRPA